MSVAEKLVTVAENVPKVFNAGKLAVISESEVLKGNKSGEIVSMTDVSPIEHNVRVKVKSKNLFNIDIIPSQSQLVNNGDGTLTVSKYGISCEKRLKELCPNLKVGCTATISTSTTFVNSGANCVYLLDCEQSWYFGTTKTITEDMLNSYVFFYCDKVDGAIVSTTIANIQIEEGSTATAYAPYVEDLSAVSVKRLGANLFEPFTADYTKATNGTTYSVIGGKSSVVINGTAEAPYGRTLLVSHQKHIALYKGITYCISAKLLSGIAGDCTIMLSSTSGDVLTNAKINGQGTYTPTENITAYIGVQAIGGETYENAEIVWQLEINTTATNYEPYQETTYTPNEDGTLEIPSLYPSMTLTSDSGVTVTANYYKDIDKAFNELTTNIALTGGN